MSKKTWFSFFTAAALCLFLSGFVAAQEITGSIVGSVKDSSGAVVVGATVIITDPAKNNAVVRTITTNEEGAFSAPNMAVSTYTVTVESPNFKKSVNTNLKLDVGQRRAIDITLEAGKIDESVTVTADPVAVELSTPTTGTTINGDQVRELSLNNRNWVQLVAIAPGVSNDLADSIATGTTTPETGSVNLISISVNGARSSQNTFTVDGADITDRGSNLTIQAYPSVDSIGEFKVLRSLYPAESGRSGGGQVNVVTRSGSNKFHGSAYEFVRNERFNANDFATNATPGLATTLGRDDNGKIKRRPFRYNDYGWTIGGPVYFFRFGDTDADEGIFKRYDKTFFFFSQEFRKDRRAPVVTSNVPTSDMRIGRFSVPVCLQATGTTAASCTLTLPANTPITNLRPISSVAQQYINQVYNKLPLPNAGKFVLSFPIESTLDFRQEILKIDHSFNQKLSMFYRFENDDIPSIDGNSIFSSGSGLPGVSTTLTKSPGRAHTVQVTYAASSNFIVEGNYTFGYGQINATNIGSLALANSTISSPLAFPRTNERIPSLTGNGVNGLVSYGGVDNFSWKGNLGGSVTWIAGNHTMKFGAVYSKYRKHENALAGNNEGLFNAFNIPGSTTSFTLSGSNSTEQSWANFLQGTNVTFTQASFDYLADLRQKAFEGFAQDEWRFRSNLTLYVGVRYSFFGSPWDKNGRLSNFDPNLWTAAAAPSVTGLGNRVPGTGNFCNGLIINSQNTAVTFPNCSPIVSPWGKFVVDASKKDFAPRVGLAWDPFGKGKTSIRTGYGIYHEQTLNATFEQNIGTNPPYQQTCQVVGTSLDNPIPGGCAVIAANTASSIRAIDPHWKTPYMQHWSLDWQQQLTKSTIVTIGYYGSKGTHLIGGFEENLVAPGKAISLGATGCAVGSSTTPTAPCQVSGQAFFTSAGTAILDQIRPFKGYRSIQVVEPRYNSNYHSLQVSAQHRFSGASQVNLAYTWAKNLTDAQNDRSTSPQNTYNVNLEKARAALDRRHILTINYVYELPFYRDQKGFVGKVLGGWQASGIATVQTGLPFTPTASAFDASGLGLIPAQVAGARPNVICDPNEGAPHTLQQWFNTSCFQVTPISGDPIGAFGNNVGNGGRGIVNGPGTRRVDFTMSKNLRFGETFRVQLRAEAFNVFNITNFRGLSTAVWSRTTQPVSQGGNGASTFGQVTTVRDPRVIQLGVKVSF